LSFLGRSSLRNRLLALFLVLVVVVGAGTLYAIERTLADDLVSAAESRLTAQGRAVATWLSSAHRVDRLLPQLAAVAGSRITIVGPDRMVESDSHQPEMVGRPLAPDDARQYFVNVPAEQGRVIRVAVPLGEIVETRARMRNRLLVGFGFGFLGALLLSWIFVRAVTKPIQSMTRTAESLATGNYDAPPPTAAAQAGGEMGVLARAMMHMAGEVKSRVSELTEQRDLLSVVVGGLVEGVVVVDAAGIIVIANAAARPLIDPEGRPSGPIALEDKLPASLAPLVAAARAGEEPEQELELLGRTVRASARPLRAGSVIVVLYDVTRMRSLEAVRREFLSNAAHELRTPVTSIAGYAETLLSGAVDADTSKEFISTIHRNARRIADMVTDLLVLDQLGGRAAVVGERGPVTLAAVVGDAVRTAKGFAPAAQIEVDVAADVSVLATREGLDHVVQNLVDNAVKYGAGSPVRVRAERVDDRVRLSIADAGPGIPAGHEDRIFERFYRVDAGRSRDQGGSGLGLAIVKSHVEAMGGRAWFEHAKPGARFVVELDAA
jgi:two-component system, OmpR family, phosphate regulon sensor histidine kinase PhoR